MSANTSESLTKLLKFLHIFVEGYHRKHGQLACHLFIETPDGDLTAVKLEFSTPEEKAEAFTLARLLLATLDATRYGIATEAWEGTNPDIPPSQDPGAKDIVLVFAADADTKIMARYYVLQDDKGQFIGLTKPQVNENVSGEMTSFLEDSVNIPREVKLRLRKFYKQNRTLVTRHLH